MGGSSSILAVLSGVATLLILLASVAATLAYLKANIAQNTISIQKEQIGAQDSRINLLEEENVLLKAQVLEIKNENHMLRGMVTHTVPIDRLTRVVEEHHESSARAWQTIMGELQRKTCGP